MGTTPCYNWKVNIRILKQKTKFNGNQCSIFKMGVIWRYFEFLVKIRAAIRDVDVGNFVINNFIISLVVKIFKCIKLCFYHYLFSVFYIIHALTSEMHTLNLWVEFFKSIYNCLSSAYNMWFCIMRMQDDTCLSHTLFCCLFE